MDKTIKEKLVKTILSFKSTENPDSAKDQKRLGFIVKCLENHEKATSKEIEDLLRVLLHADFSFLAKYGDELLEKIWLLYDKEDFYMGSTDDSESLDASKSNDLFKSQLNLFFLFGSGSKLVRRLLEAGVISIANSAIKFNSSELLIAFTSENQLSRNNLVDLLICLLFSLVDFKLFYTTLSSFIVSTNNSTMLLFKIITLFSLCMLRLDRKADFCDSLLFVIGSVLRDHARSYLKTKGRFNESLTYHKCTKKHGRSDHQYTEPIILTTKECDYLEQHFLQVVLGFFRTIIVDFTYGHKWEDFMDVFYRYLHVDELDVEEKIDPEVSVCHFLMLFLSDFIFFFVSNFCSFELLDHNGLKGFFKSSFKGFFEFVCFVNGFLHKAVNDYTAVFEFSDKRRRFLEVDCERTNYDLKDKFNHYGLALVNFFNLVDFHPVCDVLTGEELKTASLIPLCVSPSVIENIILMSVFMILRSENTEKHNFIADYRTFGFYFLSQGLRYVTRTSGLILGQMLLCLDTVKTAPKQDIAVLEGFIALADQPGGLAVEALTAFENPRDFVRVLDGLMLTSLGKTLKEEAIADQVFEYIVKSSLIRDDSVLQSTVKALGVAKTQDRKDYYLKEGLDKLAEDKREEFDLLRKHKGDIATKLQKLILK